MKDERADVGSGGEADRELLARDGAGSDQEKNRKTERRNRARNTDQWQLAAVWETGRRRHRNGSKGPAGGEATYCQARQENTTSDSRARMSPAHTHPPGPAQMAGLKPASAQGSSQPPVKPREAADLQTAAWAPTPGCPPPAPPRPCDPGQATDPMQPKLPDLKRRTGALGGL